MKGTFIVLEGGEGAGKTAVRKFLAEKLPDAVFTREPGGTPFAEKIRAVMISPEAAEASAETQFALAWAARFDHVRAKIRPALEGGKAVISERFDSATYAYQIHGQEAQHLKPLFFEYKKLLGECVPDLYILLDVLPAEGVRRAKASGKGIDHFEERDLAFHIRVRAGLIEFLKTVPHTIVDANQPLEQVLHEVLALVKQHISS
ncbi:MAG: dTMP kinase [Patescibacteria group bacterium]